MKNNFQYNYMEGSGFQANREDAGKKLYDNPDSDINQQFPGKEGSDIHEKTTEQEINEIAQWLNDEKYQPAVNLWKEVANEFHFDKPFHVSAVQGITKRLIDKGFLISKLEPIPDYRVGHSFDWLNAPDAFKVLMQDVHKLHRQYAAENVSGSWCKNAVANLFEQYLRSLSLTEKKEDWVRVEDGLPEFERIVDTWNGKSNRRAIYKKPDIFQRYMEASENERIYILHFPDVTHWRYLPEPPNK